MVAWNDSLVKISSHSIYGSFNFSSERSPQTLAKNGSHIHPISQASLKPELAHQA